MQYGPGKAAVLEYKPFHVIVEIISNTTKKLKCRFLTGSCRVKHKRKRTFLTLVCCDPLAYPVIGMNLLQWVTGNAVCRSLGSLHRPARKRGRVWWRIPEEWHRQHRQATPQKSHSGGGSQAQNAESSFPNMPVFDSKFDFVFVGNRLCHRSSMWQAHGIHFQENVRQVLKSGKAESLCRSRLRVKDAIPEARSSFSLKRPSYEGCPESFQPCHVKNRGI